MYRFLFCLALQVLLSFNLKAQKVGLVLSGGGAKGIAHIGVLKALEENHIPIDYITGTSMGAIVGAMYASGYSPTQIEQLALSLNFQDWVNGRFESDYSFFFQKTADNPSVISAKMAIDTSMRLSFRPTLVNDIPLNFALLELFSPATAVAKGNFDHLMVPYRCMASEVLSHQSIMLKRGSLAEAVRASMSVPLVYRPIKLNDKFMFDGGIYNNFPADVMEDEFKPDFVIGANVSSNTFFEYPKDDDRLMNRFFMYMLLGKSDSTLVTKNGVYIEPALNDYSALNFKPVKELIQLGYEATIAKIKQIKVSVNRQVSDEEIKLKRTHFNQQKHELLFKKVEVYGVNSQQKKYIERLFKYDDSLISLANIKRSYFKLMADEAFESVYPKIVYDRTTKSYTFEVWAKVQKKLALEIGGNISTRPISNVFLGAQLNHLNRKAYTLSTGFYTGRFYESAQFSTRVDFPSKTPLFLNSEFLYNHWNFYNTSKIFVENPSVTYIEQSDKKIEFRLGAPLNRNFRLSLGFSFFDNTDNYSPDNIYLPGDVFDKNIFKGLKTGLLIEKNSLNRKQYANKGQKLTLDLSLISGTSDYQPGNIQNNRFPLLPTPFALKQKHTWLRAKFSYEFYFIHTKRFSLGYLLEGIISNQKLFNNYQSTLLVAPAFYPLQDSRTIYLENFRANQYAAGGLKNSWQLGPKLDLRLEGYVFLPYQEFKKVGFQDVTYSSTFNKIRTVFSSGLVYNSALGPISLSYNNYDDSKRKHGLLLHLGYLIYNKRSLE